MRTCSGDESQSVESQPGRYRSVTTGLTRSEPYKASGLTKLGGDDGTRTHDPLLANSPDADNGERP
jgi:hypothetical protein